jgi:hypothetical protein
MEPDVTKIIDPYDPRATADNFDLAGYMLKLEQQLEPLRAELPEGVQPLCVPEVRRRLTEHDPFLAALLDQDPVELIQQARLEELRAQNRETP